MSSSDCNSNEDSGYSQNDAEDCFSAQGSVKPDQKISKLGSSNNKIEDKTGKTDNGDQSAGRRNQSGFDSSEDSEQFDPDEQQKLNWQ